MSEPTQGEAGHTPVPWKIGAREILYGEMYIGVDAASRSIAKMTGGYYTRPHRPESKATIAENTANAEFIVRAVNSHDDLLAACRVAQDLTDKWKRTEHGADFNEVDSVLRAAIAKAGRREV